MITPDGWAAAYRQFAASGWVGLGMATEHGGQGLPKILATPVAEMWHAANLSFSLLPPLNASVVVQAVMLLLVVVSVSSWAAIFRTWASSRLRFSSNSRRNCSSIG